MSSIIGIDPGKTGAIVGVDSDGVAWSYAMPDTPQGLVAILAPHQNSLVIVERQIAMHKQGLCSTFTTGYGYGVIIGVVAGLFMRCELVRSQDWQKVMLRGEPKVKGSDLLKKQYTAVAERLFPATSFRGPRGGINDGKAAAALMAEYGRRLLNG